MGRLATGLLGAAGALVLIGAATAGIAWSGLYDIGADAPHSGAIEKAIETVRERSIARGAESIQVPDLTRREMIVEGAEHYAAMCTGCHLAPGLASSELREGLYPRPPDFSRRPAGDPREAFWVIKHGVKMTAMPAWGTSHGDAEIWNMVAFLQQMPKLSPEEYRALAPPAAPAGAEAAPAEEGHAHGEGHGEHHHHHDE